jgi:hypothetical protein
MRNLPCAFTGSDDLNRQDRIRARAVREFASAAHCAHHPWASRITSSGTERTFSR